MYTHVYVSPSDCETPEVFTCKRHHPRVYSPCDGCDNGDIVFATRAAAESYADRMKPAY
jgi:hypothetical protein